MYTYSVISAGQPFDSVKHMVILKIGVQVINNKHILVTPF